jgi:hypothetical protein
MVRLADSIFLRLSLNQPVSPETTIFVGNNYLSYLSRPVTPTENFNYNLAYDSLLNRTPPDKIPKLNCSIRDTNVFVARFQVMATDNEFFRVATKTDPTVEDLEAISYRSAIFSTLYPLKIYLLHHPILSKIYRGFLPFGSQVKNYINRHAFGDWTVEGTPSFKDHVMLQSISNMMADEWGVPSVTINNVMYIQGQKIKSNPEEK